MKEFTAFHIGEKNVIESSVLSLQYAKVEDSIILRSGKLLFNKIESEEKNEVAEMKSSHFIIGSFLSHNRELEKLVDRPLVSFDRSHKITLDKYSDYYKMKLAFDYIDLKSVAQERIQGLDNCKLASIAKHYNINIKEYSKEENYALLYANILLRIDNQSIKPNGKSIYLLRQKYYEIISEFVKIGKISNNKAKDLLSWIEENIDITEEHFEIYVALRNFYRDQNIDEREQVILLRMMVIEMKKIENMNL